MSKLAVLGGKPITRSLVGNARLPRRRDLERKYLLKAYDTGCWDDRALGATQGAGSMGEKFEHQWARFCGSKYCLPVTNGTHALQMSLEVLEIGAGDEVIVPGLTWQATASAVCDVNAVPILVDVDPQTMCIDPEAVKRHITSRTRAIIPVHLYHRLAEMDQIMRIARKHKLWVIEDCAHTHGSRWGKKGAGSIGHLGTYSFQMSKLMTAGEGGAVMTQKASLYWKLRSLRTCGRAVKGTASIHSGNFRVTSFQAGVLLGQLAAMRKNAFVMDRNGRALDRAVAAAPGVAPLRRSKRITRQCSYAYAFLYDKDAFDGLPALKFRKALSAELGVKFGSVYEPLNRSSLYRPHTKKRHQLSKSYLKAINPARWKLPVCQALFDGRAVTSDWDILACPPNRARYLTDAITKIHEHRKELLPASRQ